MQIIKVDAIDSTNQFLKDAVRQNSLNTPTCVWTTQQLNGKGQRGTRWIAEPFKNLSLSVFLPIEHALQKQAFSINMLTMIALHSALQNYPIPQLKIKWPNDILSANKKIGGVLIENFYQNAVITRSIIGIGINVNQTQFPELPQASSIKNSVGFSLPLEEILETILTKLEEFFIQKPIPPAETLKAKYESLLFRIKKPSTFKAEGTLFTGIIQGVTPLGKLLLEVEDQVTKEFDLKEIQLLY